MAEDKEVDTSSCASCGIAEVDNVKLTKCANCDLVRYCSEECRTEHESKHEEACKKRAAELRDESLFKQPESTNMGDCPICFLPLPLDETKSVIKTCCSKFICYGCVVASRLASINSLSVCPFCREPTPDTDEESDKLTLKRAEANDPLAMYNHGVAQQKKGEHSRAFDWFTKAAELGDADAHFRLTGIYITGDGVEKDEGKFLYHLEEAAIGGRPKARYLLGLHEEKKGNIDRAVKHYIIAAKQGDDDSTKMLMTAFKRGEISKEDFAAALRAHQAAVDATRSTQRDEADKFKRFCLEKGI